MKFERTNNAKYQKNPILSISYFVCSFSDFLINQSGEFSIQNLVNVAWAFATAHRAHVSLFAALTERAGPGTENLEKNNRKQSEIIKDQNKNKKHIVFQ